MSEPATPVPAPAVPAIRRDGTVLGFDVGSRRIGVAIGSAFAAHARAVAVVDVHGNGPDWTAIERLLKEWKPDGLVVGDPLTLDGQDQPNRKRAQGFARQLRERFKLPVVMIDERSSSVEAARRFAVERAEGRKRRRDVHLCKHFTQRVLGRLVDQHAHRPVLVVLADQRDAAGKGRVEQRRQRDEEVIGEGGRRYRHGPILPAGGGMVAQRRRTAMG